MHIDTCQYRSFYSLCAICIDFIIRYYDICHLIQLLYFITIHSTHISHTIKTRVISCGADLKLLQESDLKELFAALDMDLSGTAPRLNRVQSNP